MAVSILIPAYNAPTFLKRAVESCLAQTYQNFEIIITDDSTNDECKLVAQAFAHPKIKYFKNEAPLGSPQNWNFAISKANGEYIKFLFHDDWFSGPNCLEKYVQATKDGDFVFCACTIIENGKPARLHNAKDFLNEIQTNPLCLAEANYIGAPSTTLYKKNCQLFDENLTWFVDVEFYIQLLNKGAKLAFVEEPLINVGISPAQLTNICIKNPKLVLFEMFYVYFKLYKSPKQKLLRLLKILRYALVHFKNPIAAANEAKIKLFGN